MYSIIRKALFQLDAERAHGLAMGSLNIANALASPLLKSIFKVPDKPIEVFGLKFKNPVGLPAGFDKNARYVKSLQHLGFGFIEIGAVTRKPCTGNSKPRLFRISEDRAIINRMGLNNDGAFKIKRRLYDLKDKFSIHIPIFINIAAMPDKYSLLKDLCVDYILTIQQILSVADAIVLDISCPNSCSGETFTDPKKLNILLKSIYYTTDIGELPLIVKLPHKIDLSRLYAIIDILECYGIDGITISNTNIDHYYPIKGGYSGPALKHPNLQTIYYARMRSNISIIGVGGIETAKDAQEYLDAGADLVQVGTGFVYGGPFTIKNIVKELKI